MTSTPASWQDISAQATQKVLDDIPPAWRIPTDQLPADDVLDVTGFPATSGILTDRDLEITECYATEIVARLASGEWTASEVTLAFCKRAAVAHQLTKCLTVIMFDAALERARQLDATFAKTGKVTGPLHGLPVSLKDNFNIPGYPSSLGFCSWATEPMQTESTIVTTLRDLGAVLFVKTNVPTAMMIAESVNNLYGRTLNPHNRATTSGGSSGGESALIAMKGSPLGLGTDIGGSLRIPAACTGIYTLKPSLGRFPHFDARTALAGQEAVGSVQGPMARSIPDLRLFAEHVVQSRPWRKDPKCIEIPWRSGSDVTSIPAKPRLAVVWDDAMVHPTPPVARALKAAVAKLSSLGYEIVDWPSSTTHIEALQLLGKFFVADGGKSVQKILDPVAEPWRPEMAMHAAAPDMDVYELWQVQAQRTKLQQKVLDLWVSLGEIDAVLGPATPYASPKNGQYHHISYTCIWNVMDYPATAFPTGMVADKNVDVVARDFTPFGDLDKQISEEYDPVVTHGLSVNLQLTGRRLQEERLLALTEKITHDLQA